MRSTIYVLSLALLACSACERPECANTHPVFDRYPPDAATYRNELARQFRTARHLRYWYDRPVRLGGRNYDQLYVQGDGLCARMLVVNKDTRRTLGRGGYHGAELEDVSITTVQGAGETIFVLEHIGRVVD